MGKKGKRREDPNEQFEKKTGKGMMISEQHLMDKTHMDPTTFSPFLPDDALYSPHIISTEAIKTMLLELNYLLYVDFKSFWATILYNPSLKNHLMTSLQYFHRKWMNNYYRPQQQIDEQAAYKAIKFQSAYEYTEALFQITLTIFYRIIKFNDQNAQLSRIYNLKENIACKYIFDIPKLFDLIEVYGDSNPEIVKIIVKHYVKTIDNFYSLAMNEHMGLLIKHIHRCVFQLKIISDREQFGINYSYQRRQQNQLSPGQQQLKRKVIHIMRFLSFHEAMRSICNFFPENCIDHLYFNHEIHYIQENMFYELEVALKVWDWHQSKEKLLPMINKVLKNIRDYFIEFFKRCQDLFLLNQKQTNAGTIDAYLICFDRITKDYGKRASIGKKAANKRMLILFREIARQYDLIDFLERLYLYLTMETDTLKINIDYLIDFKVSLEDQLRKHHLLQKQPERQEQAQEIQMEEKTMVGQNNSDQEVIQQPTINTNLQTNQQIKKQEIKLKPSNEPLQQMEVIVSKKKRQDDYYTKLYQDFESKIMINYDDEYDDLVDYEKKPLFMDEESSNSDSDSEEEKSHRAGVVNNMNLVKRNSVRNQPIKKEKKTQKPYQRVETQQMKKQIKKYQSHNNVEKKNEPEGKKNKPKYVDKSVKQTQEKTDPVKCSIYQDEPNCQKSKKIQDAQQHTEQKKQQNVPLDNKSKVEQKPYYRGKKHHHHNNNHNTYNDKGPKGGNKNKKKYVQK